MERHALLNDAHTFLVHRLHRLTSLFATGEDPDAGAPSADKQQLSGSRKPAKVTKANLKLLRSAFCGFHSDVLSSLVQSLPPETVDSESRFQEAVRRLLWVATPEAVCRMSGRSDQLQQHFRVDPMDIYFKQQEHSDLASFANRLADLGDAYGEDG